jgi:hypothetical protein
MQELIIKLVIVGLYGLTMKSSSFFGYSLCKAGEKTTKTLDGMPDDDVVKMMILRITGVKAGVLFFISSTLLMIFA